MFSCCSTLWTRLLIPITASGAEKGSEKTMTLHDMHEKMPLYSQKGEPYGDLPYHGHTVSTDG